ncbi:hypothetical protein Q1695_016315 [Nippostrongylus brasiliensis]|nr:hypothetical protein Q1695_016315 [Nippostrongylus brasiliensis]
MNKLQVLHIIFIVLSVTVMISSSTTSRPATCVTVRSRVTTTTPSTKKPLSSIKSLVTTTTPSTRKPLPSPAEQGKCNVQPAWIDVLFAKHHENTGLRMKCEYVYHALMAGQHYMRHWNHYIKKEFWCKIEHYESTLRWFNEHRVDILLTQYFDEKIRRIAETYPGTEYGCTTMYRLGYFFNFRIFSLCLYSRRHYANGTLAPCPDEP